MLIYADKAVPRRMYFFNASMERSRRPYIHEIPPPSYDNPLTMRRTPLAEVRSATPSTAEALDDPQPRRDHVRSGSQILAAATSSRRSSRRPSFSESLASAAATECATPPRSEPVPLQVHRPIALKFTTSI